MCKTIFIESKFISVPAVKINFFLEVIELMHSYNPHFSLIWAFDAALLVSRFQTEYCILDKRFLMLEPELPYTVEIFVAGK